MELYGDKDDRTTNKLYRPFSTLPLTIPIVQFTHHFHLIKNERVTVEYVTKWRPVIDEHLSHKNNPLEKNTHGKKPTKKKKGIKRKGKTGRSYCFDKILKPSSSIEELKGEEREEGREE